VRPPLSIVDIDYADIASQHPDGLAQLRSGEGLAGMVIRNVFPQDAMATVVERAKAGVSRLPCNDSAYYPGQVYGRVLPAEPDATLADYFAEARAFREGSRRLFEGLETDFLDRLEAVLGAMAGGRHVKLAANASGDEYQAFSLRQMLPGGEIGLHYENEAFDAESMAGLRSICGVRPHVLSVYLAVQVPERGGELSIYNIGEDDPETRMLKTIPRETEQSFAQFERMAARQPLLARTGDMLVFDAGRYFHRVTRVEGERARWTLGSFIILSEDGGTYHYFA